jgi:hypothetical protein
MRKIPKPSPTAAPLLFELDPEPLEETLTALEIRPGTWVFQPAGRVT